jgi:hypothetical protein
LVRLRRVLLVALQGAIALLRRYGPGCSVAAVAAAKECSSRASCGGGRGLSGCRGGKCRLLRTKEASGAPFGRVVVAPVAAAPRGRVAHPASALHAASVPPSRRRCRM